VVSEDSKCILLQNMSVSKVSNAQCMEQVLCCGLLAINYGDSTSNAPTQFFVAAIEGTECLAPDCNCGHEFFMIWENALVDHIDGS